MERLFSQLGLAFMHFVPKRDWKNISKNLSNKYISILDP